MKYLCIIFIGGLLIALSCMGHVCAGAVEPATAFEYPESIGRDPFDPLVREEVTQGPEVVEGASGFELLGITWDGTVSLAMIVHQARNWLVSEGMKVADMEVDRIDGKNGEVVLLGDERIVILRMLDI
jgi:hypothetical protein